jgi:hypothetical protein
MWWNPRQGIILSWLRTGPTSRSRTYTVRPVDDSKAPCCLQDGCDLPPVVVGVTEYLSGEEDVVRVELPELLSGDGDRCDPELEWLSLPAKVPFQIGYELRLDEASTA